MEIMLISEKSFFEKLPNIKFNIKKHRVNLPTFDIGKISKYENKKKYVLDKDIEILKKSDSLLVCNFDKSLTKNYIDSYSLILMGIAYFLNKKIYLLFDFPNTKNSEEIKGLEVISLKGNLKEL
jgi:hypothetical protein